MCFYYWPTCYLRGHPFYQQVLLPLWHTHHIHEVVESDHQVGHEEDHTDRMFIKDFQHYIRVAVHTYRQVMASNSVFLRSKLKASCNLWQLANNSLLSSGHCYEKTDKRPPKSSIVLQKESIYIPA